MNIRFIVLSTMLLGCARIGSMCPPYALYEHKDPQLYPFALISESGQKFRITKTAAKQSETIKHYLEDNPDITEFYLQRSAGTTQQIAQLLTALEENKNLKGEDLINTLKREVSIADPFELILTANYLDTPQLVAVAAKTLALQVSSRPMNILKLGTLGKTERENFRALIARYYLLQNGKDIPLMQKSWYENNNNYVFSLDEYFVNQPQLLKGRVPYFGLSIWERLMPYSHSSIGYSGPAPKDDLQYAKGIDLSGLALNTICGLWRLPAIRDCRTLYLENNKLECLDSDELGNFHSLAYLILRNNRFKALDPALFLSLPRLNYLDLRNNPLTPENKRELREKLSARIQELFISE